MTPLLWTLIALAAFAIGACCGSAITLQTYRAPPIPRMPTPPKPPPPETDEQIIERMVRQRRLWREAERRAEEAQ